ncbi:peptidoglycan DD-metalloendopeptidase family protein [Paenibacillus sp. MMS20-IR301]|uniref:murein hydrolase activator EnvC family protein n=1 Tax=Paenibacillus sp. MMS20-IR301 TaxID=2895946 RepID=UPI0028EE3D05|nr:peptidoglycan DD-metalloendopeptidase family protein [Paenibacillus sp. MMS20-IR301]WNS42701.1 peptidoglycan DD-metalloendopeptidase family protein [Paenibacillus sp. MMS20-IR301]
MKKIAAGIAVTLLAVTMFGPSDGYAKKTSVAEIDKQLKQLQQEVQAAKAAQEKAASRNQEAQHYKNKTTLNLEYVLEQIEQVKGEMTTISGKIASTEESLVVTTSELDDAEARVASREKLLESRVRLMYTDGAVSYLDVLLSSTSFSDFLDRADSLKMIVDQDQDLLVQHKLDKETVIAKKQELEGQYAQAKQLYTDLESQRSVLKEKEAEKQELIAYYDEEIQEAEVISEEQNAKLVQLASDRSALEEQKDKLKAEEAARRAAAAKAEAARRAAAAAKAAKAASSSRSSVASSAEYAGGNGPFLLPVGSARISSPYGIRTHPVTGEVGKMHTGVDFAVPQGTNIHAADAGTVLVAEWWSGYGYCVIVDHGGGVWTLYGHIREGGILVKPGDRVARGQTIAESGATGRVTGPHLHFEVRIDGKTVDPMPYL